MEFLELAKKRYSVRKFEDRVVEKEKLQKIIKASQVAPTAANLQPQRLLVVKDKEGLHKLSLAANIYRAPLAIIVCGNLDESWVRSQDKESSAEIDATIITDHMMLEATDLKLGTLWVCAFDPVILRREFSIPQNYKIINILAIGYAEGEVKSPERHAETRKDIVETVFYEHF
jgi:nitroreductase